LVQIIGLALNGLPINAYFPHAQTVHVQKNIRILMKSLMIRPHQLKAKFDNYNLYSIHFICDNINES